MVALPIAANVGFTAWCSEQAYISALSPEMAAPAEKKPRRGAEQSKRDEKEAEILNHIKCEI